MLGENNYSNYKVPREAAPSLALGNTSFKGFKATSSFQEVFAEYEALVVQLKGLTKETYRLLRLGHDVAVRDVQLVLARLAELTQQNPYPCIYLCARKNKDQYLVEHALRTCLYSLALGLATGLDSEELAELGLAALLSDVGKIMIPDTIVTKEGALSSAEYAVIRVHPMEGRKILTRYTDAPETVIDVVMTHHEQVNGKGYPQGLRDEEIPTFSRIVAIADAYDAMTSERSYARARSVSDAKSILWEQKSEQFDAEYVALFLHLLGEHQAGELLMSESGERFLLLESLRPSDAKALVFSESASEPVSYLCADSQPFSLKACAGLEFGASTESVFAQLDSQLQSSLQSYSSARSDQSSTFKLGA